METNSVKKHLTKETAISEIKLSLGADFEKNKVFLVVEGSSDQKILKKFRSSDIEIFISYSGKQGIEEIVNSEIVSDNRVIGIRDKDYCTQTSGDRIFFYDKCCSEMMMLSFHEVFESIYYEFYEGNFDSMELKVFIFRELSKISKFRKYNEENRIGIRFEGFHHSSLLDNENKLKFEDVVNRIKKMNPGRDISLGEILNSEEDNIEYFDITNGHDFIWFFQTLCNKEKTGKGVSADQITSVLRGSFDMKHFSNTDLYSSVNKYCVDNFIPFPFKTNDMQT